MTRTIFAACFVLPLALNAASPSSEEMALHDARTFGALAQELIKVVNQDGMPVAGACVFGASQIGGGYNDYIAITGNTDSNGECVVEVRCTYGIRCQIAKKGFYDSEFLVQDYQSKHTVFSGKWMPFGSKTAVVLKEVKNPVAIGKLHFTQNIPEYGKWLGYDLQAADWLPPFGSGKVADVKIRFSAREVGMFDFGYKMELSFEDIPFAGIIRQKKYQKSVYPCAYFATTNDVYKSAMSFEVDRSGGKRRVWDYLENDEYLVFRTRTKVDEHGQLLSAHYGRIDGEWIFHELHTMRIKGIFFNTEPNDLNLEDEFSYEEQKRRERQREESSSAK